MKPTASTTRDLDRRAAREPGAGGAAIDDHGWRDGVVLVLSAGLLGWLAGCVGGAPRTADPGSRLAGPTASADPDRADHGSADHGSADHGSAPASTGHEGCSHGDVTLRASFDRGPERWKGDWVRFRGFDCLAGFSAPETGTLARSTDLDALRIRDDVRDLDEQWIAVEGFMVPYQIEDDGKVSVFYLTRDLLTCSAGPTPRINEAIEVTLAQPVEDVVGRTVIVTGPLSIQPVIDEFGALVCLYRMRAVQVRQPD